MARFKETRTICPECVKQGWNQVPNSQFIQVIEVLCRTHQIVFGKGSFGRLVAEMFGGKKEQPSPNSTKV